MISFLISFAFISHLLKKKIQKKGTKKCPYQMRTDNRIVLKRILKGLTKLAKVGSFLNKF